METYARFVADLKERIRAARVRAALAVNKELILLYWDIGREIIRRRGKEGWGTKVAERLARDLRREFPDMRGFSRANLQYMRAFAAAYPSKSIVQQLAGQLPWGHHMVLLDKVGGAAERLWYMRNAVEHGWSRNVLVHHIESGLRERQGKAVTNFSSAMPSPRSDLAIQLVKDPYHFDFLALGSGARERAVERGLVAQAQRLLMELGVGFAFVGRQVHLEVGGEDFYIDLLFYHLQLRCYVVIELKAGPFKPEYAGKMNFYLSAVDDRLRHPEDRPSIGLILCKARNGLIVEYALRDTGKPIGVSAYRLTRELPSRLRGALPSSKELGRRLSGAG